MADPIKIQIDVAGALARLRVLGDKTANLAPVLGGPVNRSVDSVFIRQFTSEGAFLGTKWRSLAPVTLALRKRRGHGRGGIGRDTDELWASFTKGGLGPKAIKVVGPRSLERGSQVPYAAAFHGGYRSRTFVVVGGKGNSIYPIGLRRKAAKRVPGRPIVPDAMPPEIIRTWEKMLVDFLAGGG